MGYKEPAKSELLDKLLECIYILKLRGFKLISRIESAESRAFIDVYTGLYIEDRDFKVEVWVHAVKEKEDTYLYAVLFIASKLKTSNELLPAVRAEIARWDANPSEFPKVITGIIPVIANYFSQLGKARYYRRLRELENTVEKIFGVKTKLSYMKLSDKWFEDYE